MIGKENRARARTGTRAGKGSRMGTEAVAETGVGT
jgi:hypothetical protein